MKRLLLLTLFLCQLGTAQAAELRVDLGRGMVRYQTGDLLRRADSRHIVVPADVAFQRTMGYRAVPLLALLQPLTPKDQLEFVGKDGFVARIPAALILNRQGSEAWLAIEDDGRPWPRLRGNHADAGPFYVVWTRPEGAGVSSEQWPYQLQTIHLAGNVSAQFPAIFPDREQPAHGPVQRGFGVFQRTCFACHTLNRQGNAALGPDLNVPYNPTEYLRTDLLRAFIRNPQSLHYWPQSKMHGLDRQSLSDADLDAVLAYLRHMAARKVQPLNANPKK